MHTKSNNKINIGIGCWLQGMVAMPMLNVSRRLVNAEGIIWLNSIFFCSLHKSHIQQYARAQKTIFPAHQIDFDFDIFICATDIA